VTRSTILAAVLVALSLLSTGCGVSDYMQSVTLSSNGASSGGFFNLVGIDGTVQLQVTANYHSGKTVPVTESATYSVTTVGTDDSNAPLPAYGPNSVPISASGLMTAVAALCTWQDVGNPLPTPPKYNWVYTGYYQVTATYKGKTSQPIAIGVGSQAGNTAPDGACGPA
jgi:hypothetical protein